MFIDKRRRASARNATVEIGLTVAVLTAVGVFFMTRTGRGFLERLIQSVPNTSEDIKENVKKTVSTVKQAGVTAINDVRDGIEELQEKAEQVLDDDMAGNSADADDIPNTVDDITDSI